MANRVTPLETKKKLGTLRPDRVPTNTIKPHHLHKIPKVPEKYKDIAFAKAKFKTICQYLLNENRLIQPDVDLVELLTDCHIEYQNAWENIQSLKTEKDFVRLQSNQGGQEYETLTQYWSVYKTAQEMIRKISNDLGLTPAARTKVGLPSGNKNENDALKIRNMLYGGLN
jgi:P27 family predicted phage terminase small subunit